MLVPNSLYKYLALSFFTHRELRVAFNTYTNEAAVIIIYAPRVEFGATLDCVVAEASILYGSQCSKEN